MTDLGRSQAEAVAGDLRATNFHCVYSSPLQRASQTASIISQALAIEDLRLEPDLSERDYGILTGRPLSDIPILARKIFVSHGFRHVIDAEGIEDYTLLWTRAGNVLRKIQDRHGGQTVLIVAHNEILRMIRANFTRRSWEEELRFPPLLNCQAIALGLQP